jgi:hypothetical protein
MIQAETPLIILYHHKKNYGAVWRSVPLRPVYQGVSPEKINLRSGKLNKIKFSV